MKLKNLSFSVDSFNYVFASRYEEIIFKLSLMLLVLDGGTGWNAHIALRILCTLMLVFDRYAGNKLFWGLIVSTLLFSNSLQWYNIDNHKALFMYWTFVLCSYLWLEKKEKFIRINAQLLVGLVMGFAVFQKIINGFAEPGFLHGRFLFDGRFVMITHFLTGIPMEDIVMNKTHMSIVSMLPLDGAYTQLTSNAFMKIFTYYFQVFGLFVESIVAMLFLFANKFKSHYKDYALIAFCLGTYFIFPVIGFSSILLLLGIAQVKSQEIFRYYIGAFILIQFIQVPWQEIFFYFENM
ncbi:MAG: hypothetical protein AAGG68_20705 [Bacteroidota bacterium]